MDIFASETVILNIEINQRNNEKLIHLLFSRPGPEKG